MRASYLSAEEQALIRFFQMTVHELRNPLTVLIGALQSIEQQMPPSHSSEGLQHITVARNEAVRLACLLTDFSESLGGTNYALPMRLKALNLSDFLFDTVQAFQVALCGHRIAVHTDTTKPPLVLADDLHLELVFFNLLSNAVKYSFEGSEIHLVLSVAGNDVRVSIFNQGCGIHPDQLDEIFMPFIRGKNVVAGGTGLGLYISRQIAERHGGRLWAESIPGQSATFHLDLPLASDASRRERREQQEAARRNPVG